MELLVGLPIGMHQSGSMSAGSIGKHVSGNMSVDSIGKYESSNISANSTSGRQNAGGNHVGE